MAGGMSPTSSSKIAPRCAASNRPWRSNFLTVVAMVVLGDFGFAVQYGMFKDRRTYSS